jgi:predicted nucleic acid-binding protein
MPSENRTPSLPIAVIDNPLLSRLVSLEIAVFLPQIFDHIRIPPEVKLEAEASPNKEELFDLLDTGRDFFVDCFEADITNKEFLKTILGAGEAAVIAQAEITYSVVLTDDKKGYTEAIRRDLQVFRTGTILCLLKEAGFILLVAPYLDKLEGMGFWIRPFDKHSILKKAGEIE